MTPNLLDPQFYADIDAMHAALRQLRVDGPVWKDRANDLVAVLGHEEIIAVEKRADLFSSDGGYRSVVQPPGLERDMIALDDPDHAAQRSLVSRMFTPRAVRRLIPFIESNIAELIAAVRDRGEMDVVDDLAAPLSSRLAAHIIGFGPDDAPSVRSWSERLMRIDRVPHEPAVMAEFMAAIMEFSQVIGPIADARREAPADDLVSVWATAELNGCPVGPETLVQETGLFISGGAETTRTVIARGLAELAGHPEDWEAMGADPDLIPGAVEEMVRWVTPLNNFFRTALAPASVGGHDVDAGQRLILLYPSANRDERVFKDPYTFDIRRSPNPHVAFGFGTHFCLGSSLARLQLRLLLGQLTRQLKSLEVVELPDIEPNIFAGAVRSFRLGFEPRGATP
ncbi:MAG TPA: cytochrome P450 [Acidimicrobiales bacterium]|jgi:cytochrome P450 family 142 subfamily A polypeptide 1|nr:cytochrome P450 [Acidimicrobiales bacterium]